MEKKEKIKSVLILSSNPKYFLANKIIKEKYYRQPKDIRGRHHNDIRRRETMQKRATKIREGIVAQGLGVF